MCWFQAETEGGDAKMGVSQRCYIRWLIVTIRIDKNSCPTAIS
jgi:hypothetical protein